MDHGNPEADRNSHTPLAQRAGFLPDFAGMTGLLLAAIGSISVLVLLLGPPSLSTEAHGTVACVSVLGGNSVYDEDDDSVTSEWWADEEDTCEQLRQERISTSVILAVPTAIAGSVGVTALVFRRRLSTPEEAKRIEDGQE
jgi:hypothetical protein